MYLLIACDDGDVLNTIRIGVIIAYIVRIVLPLIVILFATKDFSSVVFNGNKEKLIEAFKKFVMRIIAALVVYCIPIIIDTVMDLVGKDALTYHTCINNATPEGIRNAYYEREKRLIAKAKETLDFAYFADAKSYLAKITEPDRKKELEAELKQIEGYMAIRAEISAMTKKEQYEPLKSKINGVGDGEVRTKLLEELEAKYKTLYPERPPEGDDGDPTGTVSGGGIADVDIGGTIIKQEETESLKVYIHKINTYYVTQMWIKDPYHQLNKFDSPQYGQTLYRPGQLLQNAISVNGLSDKLIVGFNASGFYLKNVYDADSVNYYPPYDKTSVGTLVITDGKVVRNAYDKAYKTWYVAGVTNSGELKIYTDEKTNDINAKQQWANGVINEVRNTFTFAGPLVINGQATSSSTSFPGPGSALNRQAICQIDNNNFILITGTKLTKQNLIDIMLKANCKTGTNFDGGGSIALLYKSKGSSNIDTIIGNGRALSEVGYIVEQ